MSSRGTCQKKMGRLAGRLAGWLHKKEDQTLGTLTTGQLLLPFVTGRFASIDLSPPSLSPPLPSHPCSFLHRAMGEHLDTERPWINTAGKKVNRLVFLNSDALALVPGHPCGRWRGDTDDHPCQKFGLVVSSPHSHEVPPTSRAADNCAADKWREVGGSAEKLSTVP